MSLESAITFFIAIFVFSITPGPGVFAILARALVHGAKRCVMLALGMAVSDVVYLILACFGLATIAQNWGEVFTIIRYVGALYLLYLGYKMFTTLPTLGDNLNHTEVKQSKTDALASFTQGFLISASNPKVILFYISFLPTFIDLTRLNAQDIVTVSVLSLIALMMGLMLIALAAGKAATMLKTEKAQARLNKGAGGIMIAAGTYLAVHK
ncbi:LysE family translocator [Vibrio sp. SCSIO 43136]|uniref:LysE family translocator n=1 Tax=Vibrio sp. SCSIO 43136 TaxID=2819101 RepID=UPI0020757E7A|nr:LysE family translocator [Vibrio sp. SCSIO 43136]USD66127.1 LysE family translocator [Vibrio sp. SCSIO 43136]